MSDATQTVWILGQIKSPPDAPVDWELGGVFSTRAKAIGACVSPMDCVWPEKVDEFHGVETSAPPDQFFPLGGPNAL